MLDASLISIMSKAMAPITLELPPERFFPPMDLDFAAPLRCLSVENVLTVFSLLLREEKVIFLCRSNALLTEVMETFRSLLFPLRWSSCFITRLPDSLCALLEAPGGFMIGLHVTEYQNSKSENIWGKSISYVKIGNKKYEKMGGWSGCIPVGSYIVDLSENLVLQLDQKKHGVLHTSTVGSSMLKFLPAGPRKRIELKLNSIVSLYSIGPQVTGLEQFDSPFEFKDDSEAQNWENFPTLEIRDCFVVLMADILGHVALYASAPSKDIYDEDYRSFEDEFDVNRYISDADKSCRQLLSLLVETQMFSFLLQTRSDKHESFYLEFFETISHILYSAGLSALSASDRRFESINGHVHPIQLLQLPAPLHILYVHYQMLKHTPSVHKAVQGIYSAGSSVLRQHSGKSNGYGNKLLDELMIHLLTPEFRPPAGDFAHLELDFNTLREKSRYELETTGVYYHSLQDTTKGPLMLPGPKIDIDHGHSDIPCFRYADGWPVLNPTLLTDFSCCHPELETMSVLKAEEYNTKRNFVLAIIPSLETRSSLLSSSPLVFPMRQGDKLSIRDASNPDIAKSMVLDIYSMSITSLSLRAMSQTIISENDLIDIIFEIFGVLAHAESYGLLFHVEECVLLSVLIVCGILPSSVYSDYRFFHAACCVVYDTICNTAGISIPSCLTNGIYMSSLVRFKNLHQKLKNGTERKDKISPKKVFNHLQDIGCSWFSTKSVAFYPDFTGVDNKLRSSGNDDAVTDVNTPEKNSPLTSPSTVLHKSSDIKRSPLSALSSAQQGTPGSVASGSNSPKRLWSRFLKKDSPVSNPASKTSDIDIRLAGSSLFTAKELNLSINCSSLYALSQPKCNSLICSESRCCCFKTFDGHFEYKKSCIVECPDGSLELDSWCSDDLIAYVNDVRLKFSGSVKPEFHGDKISNSFTPSPVKLSLLPKFSPGLCYFKFVRFLLNCTIQGKFELSR